MTWRSRLLPASFNGVPFLVPGSTRTGGRRLAVHEYPLRDRPYAEDLGRRARTWSVDALLLGPTYDLQLKALVAALELPAPGLLSHPVYGLQRVAVERFRVALSTEEGGLARVSFECVEAGSNAMPGALADTLGAVGRAVSGVLGAAQGALAPVWQVLGQASTVYQAVSGLLDGVLALYALAGGGVGMTASARAAQVQRVTLARADLAAWAGDATLVGATLARETTALRTLAAAPWRAYQALVPLWAWGADLPAVPVTTPSGRAQANNQAALVGAVRDLAVAEGTLAALSALARADDAALVARLADGIPSARQDLLALRGVLLGAIDARASGAADAAFGAWQTLRAAVAVDLAERAVQAPVRRLLLPAATLPALVLAYGEHGDAGRADDLVRRNKIRHPGFVAGGVGLEVVG